MKFNISMFIKKLNLRDQLLLSFFLLFTPLTLAGTTITYTQIQHLLKKNYERELKNSTNSLTLLIKTAASVSVKNRLRAIAEKNLEIAEHYYNQYRSGRFTRQQALETIEEIFMSQQIGLNGYIYCLNSKGDLLMHPNAKLRGLNAMDQDLCKRQISLKEGYMEYELLLPGEQTGPPKAMYMVYFPPLDWIISVSAYRKEFVHLVEMDDFRSNILSYKLGTTGYIYVFNAKGDLLIHPWLQGKNMQRYSEVSDKIISHIMTNKRGQYTYSWQNPDESEASKKIIFFDYLPEYEWFVASCGYVKEVDAPLQKMMRLLFMILVIIFFLAALFTVIISTSITHPLKNLMEQLELGAKGNYSIRMDYHHPNEIGRLSRYFNDFMNRLEKNHAQIRQEIRKQLTIQDALKQSELKLMALFNQSFQFSAILTPDGRVESVNETALTFIKCCAQEIAGLYFWETPWWTHDTEMQEKAKKSIERAANGEFQRLEVTHKSGAGEIRFIDFSVKPVLDKNGVIAFIMAEGRDMTDQKASESDKLKLEARLHQAQKMEAIGTLAGGIAHNFNNILMNIQGRVSLLKMDKSATHGDTRHLANIETAVQRAETLTRQLLAFARGGKHKATPSDLNTLIAQENRMFGETRKEIRILESFDSNLWQATVDQGQIQQVLLNLYVNAWQAMTRGGEIHVRTRNKTITAESRLSVGTCGDVDITTGNYVIVSVRDTGTGMDKETCRKIFDPFFTTKPPGQGTGLGLASAYGIIKNHGGFINLHSIKGEGTTFHIYLPATRQKAIPLPESRNSLPAVTGEGTILLVDDEKNILDVGKQMLERLGYRLLTAQDGKTAIEIYRAKQHLIRLVIMDMVMPGMDGEETFGYFKKINPQIKVLLASGYGVNEQVAGLMLQQGCRGFIQKPFTLEALSKKVKKALG